MKKTEQKRRFEKNDGDGEMAPLLRHLVHNLEDKFRSQHPHNKLGICTDAYNPRSKYNRGRKVSGAGFTGRNPASKSYVDGRVGDLMIFSGFHECVGCTPHLPHVHAYSET